MIKGKDISFRLDKGLLKLVKIEAAKEGISMKKWVARAIEAKLGKESS